MAGFPKKLAQKLEKRRLEDALRVLPEPHGLVDFSSNDYLGFAREKSFSKLTENLLGKKQFYNNGASGSRLLAGNHVMYTELEGYLTSYHKSGSALVFNSGYDANIGLFSSVPQRGDIIFYDELVHASIRDGIGASNAKGYKFAHNDLSDLQERAKAALGTRHKNMMEEVYVVTESVFSMDGDSPDLKKLASFCTKNGFHLIVDEAHAIGIFGGGRGLVHQLALESEIFARVVTFGKALGSHGAAVLGSGQLKNYLVNFARSLIYTTALPPHTIATTLSGYRYLEQGGQESRMRLFKKIQFFNNQVRRLNIQKGFSKNRSAIQWMLCPGNETVKQLSLYLQGKGFDVKPILSPTVKQGEERLRFCLHEYNTEQEISEVLAHVKNYITT